MNISFISFIVCLFIFTRYPSKFSVLMAQPAFLITRYSGINSICDYLANFNKVGLHSQSGEDRIVTQKIIFRKFKKYSKVSSSIFLALYEFSAFIGSLLPIQLL